MQYLTLLEEGKINVYSVNYNKLRKNDMLIDLINKYSYCEEKVIKNLKVRNKYIPHSTNDYSVVKCDVENYKEINGKNRTKKLLVDVKERRQYYPIIYKILKKESIYIVLKLLEKWIDMDEEYDIRKSNGLGIEKTFYDELNPIAKDTFMDKYQIIYEYFNLFEFTLINSEDLEVCENKLKKANNIFLKTKRKSELKELKKEIQNLRSIINYSKENIRIINKLNIKLNINNEKTSHR